ncbi:hypothetical protein EDC94DRAFT_627110 [Helicostylum pulchrum]|nr:hypothetical protein EDC94DRAFT_627110 [Helicostylum pulchrum]
MDSTTLSIKNASGKTFSLLNDTFKLTTLNSSMNVPIAPRRKYHCSEPGCNKSFTTSGHLARHNRIHTGEKNFLCLHPGCPSRFSRQDNMMQHYRTHLSQKLRRQQQQQQKVKEEPQLYCHSFYGREDNILFQPLVTRQRRSTTMPSLPYPPIDIINRPKRAHSTSSTCSSDSSSSFSESPSPPTTMQQYPYHYHSNSHHRYHSQPHYHFQQSQQQQPQQQQSQQSQQQQNHHHHHHHNQQQQQKPVSNLYHLASIVSTFG